jgi:hypothetical protein
MACELLDRVVNLTRSLPAKVQLAFKYLKGLQMKLSVWLLSLAACLLCSGGSSASSVDSGRFIRGSADPGAQIVVVNEATGTVAGFVAHQDGAYAAGPLAPGRYTIYEDRPHHAKRHLSIDGKHDGAVDL